MGRAKVKPLPSSMLAARLHAIGEPLHLDRIPIPQVRPMDVLVEVKVCGIVPNLQRVIGNYWGTQVPNRKLFPTLPAIFGLDPAGVVARVGEQVTGVQVGDRVYVNPGRSCGSCKMCRTGRELNCPEFTFQGYFGRSRKLMDDYPYGGFSQYLTAPVRSIVHLPDALSFRDAARLGYLGTAYAALKKIGVGPGETLLINGISGTLGVCAAMVGLAMGAAKIVGVGRNKDLLERVKALKPGRISVYSAQEAGSCGDLTSWVQSQTGGAGAGGFIDCLPPGAPASTMLEGIYALRRGGHAINVGAMSEVLPLNVFWMMSNQIRLEGSVWFSTAEAEELVGMIEGGMLDLSAFQHRIAPLSQINQTFREMNENLDGGFANYVIDVSEAAPSSESDNGGAKTAGRD